MRNSTKFVGLDVHAETISIAIADVDGERFVGKIPNDIMSIRKTMKKLGPKKSLAVCYEAGPCGYGLYWQLMEMGVSCTVVAPSLIPVKKGDRIKTDKRDALKLARSFRGGDLTSVWVPTLEHEALRDLVRARDAAKRDQRSARHRLQKFLLRHGRRPQEKMSSWTLKYWKWLDGQKFETKVLETVFDGYRREVIYQTDRIKDWEVEIDKAIEEAPASLREVVKGLQALRGVAKVTAIGVATEIGTFSRFKKPQDLMGYGGVVPSEWSSGKKTKRGGITKTGNGYLRRLVVESSWFCRHKPNISAELKKRQEGLDRQVKDIAWKAQKRLYHRYWYLVNRGKLKQVAVTAVGRELLAFIWAIATYIEQKTESA